MKLHSLHELFIHELQDLHSAEKQLLKAIPQMGKAASSSELKSAFESHLTETENQVKRLESVFAELNESPGRAVCKGMKGLIAEGSAMAKEEGDVPVKDAGLIVAAQKIEHYEIASYGSVCVFAEMLGFDRVKQILKETMAEEEAADKKLTQLAENVINIEAAAR